MVEVREREAQRSREGSDFASTGGSKNLLNHQNSLFCRMNEGKRRGNARSKMGRYRSKLVRFFQGKRLHVKIGFGTGPNLPFIASFSPSRGVDLVGLEPNQNMFQYAKTNALESGFIVKINPDQQTASLSSSTYSTAPVLSLSLVEGVSQQLPFPDGSFDAAVCTLVLCSVVDPDRSLSELARVLKPGAPLLFIEHVAAPEDKGLVRLGQKLLNPLQRALADGCSLTRDTGEVIMSSNGFVSSRKESEGWARSIPGLGIFSPHVAGIVKARAAANRAIRLAQ
jgi:SAM-dependent methyltransferase